MTTNKSCFENRHFYKDEPVWIVYEVHTDGSVTFFDGSFCKSRKEARDLIRNIKGIFGDLTGKFRVERYPAGYFAGGAESPNTKP